MQKEQMSASEYEAWLSKFEAKKTTDDCYTPAAIYEAVKGWAVEEYKLRGLDSQKESKKQLFGDGFLISEKKAAEWSELRLIASVVAKGWTLSEREMELIRGLD